MRYIYIYGYIYKIVYVYNENVTTVKLCTFMNVQNEGYNTEHHVL